MKKPVIVLCAAAAVIYGTYALVSSLQKEPAAAANAPAATGDVLIMPEEAFATSELQARLENKVGLGADPGVCRWFVNDVEVVGVNGGTLVPDHFKKGDAVRVENISGGTTRVSETIVIANSAPHISQAILSLEEKPSARVNVQMSGMDADGDPLTYTYEWFKNGQRISGQSDKSIDASQFKKDDAVHAVIVASDGKASSAPRKTDPMKFGSNAPKITSTPPAGLEEGRLFVYQVKAAPGTGSLRYELVEAPDGMVIDRNGRIEWTVPQHEDRDNASEHKAVVRVTDSIGAWSTQEFRITTSIQAGSAGQ